MDEQDQRHHTSRLWGFVRLAIRLAVLIAGGALALRLSPSHSSSTATAWWQDRATGEWSAVLPSLSPHLGLCSAMALRAIPALFFLCLPVAVLAVFRRRWFCLNVCPTGLMTEYAGMILPKAWRMQRFPRIARWVVLFTFVGAVFGYPFFLWLDPLAMFHGLLGGWRKPLVVWNLMPGILLLVVVLVSTLWPGAWCYRACPLGYCQELLWRPWRALRRRTPSEPTREDAASVPVARRAFVIGTAALAAGAAGWFTRRARAAATTMLRPPGSVADAQFTALCARCGNCMRICPSGIIRPDAGRSGVAGFLAPVLDFSDGYCLESCRACAAVCPTDAIAHLTLAQKRRWIIGLAVIDHARCWVWNGKRECDRCAAICPAEAIDTCTVNPPMPELLAEKCNGCGKCVRACPVEGGSAIRVAPRQTKWR